MVDVELRIGPDGVLSVLSIRCYQQPPNTNFLLTSCFTCSFIAGTFRLQGKWQLAESVFQELEAEALGHQPVSPASDAAAAAAELAALPVGHAAAGSLWSAAELSGALPALPPSFGDSVDAGLAFGGSGGRASMDVGFNPLEAYGLLPTSLAEQVCVT